MLPARPYSSLLNGTEGGAYTRVVCFWKGQFDRGPGTVGNRASSLTVAKPRSSGWKALESMTYSWRRIQGRFLLVMGMYTSVRTLLRVNPR